MKIGSTFNHEIYGPLKITGKRYSRMGNKSLLIGTDEQGETHELDGSEKPAKPEKASPKFLKEAAEMFGMTQGPQGEKGMDADEEAIIAAVIPRVLERIQLPENGKDGADADTELIIRELLPLVMEKMPKPEKMNEASIVSKVLSRIRIPQDGKDGVNGKDGSPDTPSEVKEKLESLKGDDRLDARAIKNLPKTQIGGGHSYTGQVKVDTTDTPGNLEDKIIAGSNITITKGTNANGTKKLTIASSGGGGGGGQVDSIVAGNNIDVDATDPANPIVSVETLTLADISDVTASAAELNVLDGIPGTLTATELGYVDGVTSSIQTQLGAKQATITFGTGVQTALGVNVGSAGAPVLLNGALGTPSSGTLTNATGLPIAGLVASTSTAIGVGSVELGHASDTTISRSAAGVLAVEGVVIPSISSTNTLTNKRVTKRVLALSANSATPSINTDLYDVVHITSQTAAITSFTTGLSGTPVDGDMLRISVTGTASVALTFGSSFEASTVALSTTTSGTTRLDMGFIWNTETSKWRQIAVA